MVEVKGQRPDQRTRGEGLWTDARIVCICVLLTANMVYSCVCERGSRRKKKGFHSFTRGEKLRKDAAICSVLSPQAVIHLKG